MTTTTTARPHASLAPLGATEVRWAGGFWGDTLERTRATTVPSIWASLADPAVSPGWRNFRIAAGEEEGTHAGPPFLDGDLYKWLEAAISLLATQPDAALEARIDEIIALLASIQREDGYLHTAVLIDARNGVPANPLQDRFNFETYNLGHLITAGVRHFRVTGRTDLLDVAERAAGFLQGLADDHPVQLAASAICPSHYMGVVDLYRATGNESYLRLSEAFLRVRDEFDGGDDNQDRIPVREQRVAAGHAVRANYLYAGLADLVAETGDAELGAVLGGLWDDVVDTKLYLTGGCGALYDGASPDGYPWQGELSRVHQAYGRAYQLPNTTAHNETCANIGMILWSERMLALTGDAKYADVIERIAFNSFLSGIDLDGDAYFYTNPLRQVRDLPYPLRMPGETALDPVPAPPPSDERLRTEYLSVFCCPPNVARTLAQFHERAMAVTEGTLWVHQYGSAEASVDLGAGRTLRVRETTDYPWDETIAFEVLEATGVAAIRLRIPGWSSGATITVNGEPVEVSEPGTYTSVEREWSAGDRLNLTLPMPVRMLRANRLAEEVTNQVALQRGPLVYALESHDAPGAALENIALRRGTAFSPVDIEQGGRRLVAIDAEAVVLPDAGDDLYSDIDDAAVQTTPIRLIPYFAWGNRGASEMSVWLPVVW
ncbi:glycoside hydrolase family 127 protein [Agromyces atrinae]|uniref:Glycoside hydrolase family 127 protein n=1 Tax=Agromyces atrinae TaxID=592376 RepID=A0A4Q2MGH9_9MICO|nr:beta-L-arabinofuranosidase domain-containing protein [Agromyces atrinae]NYD67523.1 hypothetical protein [Agromyces atrinae]RXZ88260.1 hypothetical protein ESP50_03525 [Agromyces atrinae]